MKKKILLISVLAAAMLLTGCSGTNDDQSESSRNENKSVVTGDQNGNSSSTTDSTVSETSTNSSDGESSNPSSGSGENGNSSANVSATELEVCFGDDGAPFTLHLYDNPTAAAIARHVGTANWRLPIYHFDDYENWEVMQYYDIPSRYEIPSDPETVTSEKAGEVYYSEPNRIVLFYGDAEVSSEYTKVGYFDFTEEFKQAVESNPVLEGWGNKIVLINSVS